jgi:TPR repeat protein
MRRGATALLLLAAATAWICLTAGAQQGRASSATPAPAAAVEKPNPIRLAGTDIIRILPSGPGTATPPPFVNPTPIPTPLPTPTPTPSPGPKTTTPTPSPTPGPKPGGIAGRFIKLQVRLGSLPGDASKGWIGVKLDALELPLAISVGLMSASGALVTEVTGGGPAAQGGMRAGDVAVSLNGSPIANVNDFRQRLSQSSPGTTATLEVWRFTTEERDYLATLRRLADDGNAAVMFRLGLMYATANGVPRDDFEAVRWYRKGANAGNPASTVALAYMTLDGRGTDKNPQEAVRLLRAAADAGNLDAMWRLGNIMLEGKVVTKDAAQAAQLFQKAAEAGHAASMVDLGLMYNYANGLPQNIPEAARWYKRAADLGNSAGMVNLGVLHQQGRGVNQSDTAAVELYRKAADLGHIAGIHNLAAMLDSGRGVPQKDPERAAELIMRALGMGNDFSYKQMTENATTWTKDFRRSMQRRLKDEGLYTGPIDGEFGQSTSAAITAMFNRDNR